MKRALTTTLSLVLATHGLLLLLAGRLTYWQAWLYTALSIAVSAATYLALKHRQSLIQERLHPDRSAPAWDLLSLKLSGALYVVTLIISALDAGRYRLSPALGTTPYLIALTAFIAGHSVFLWAKSANDFFSTVVRIQSDRGHTVCDRGPYRHVRHPGYLGGVLYTLAIPILLGSLWGLLPQFVAVCLLIRRTYLEDRYLQRHLHGYKDYSRRTRYMLIPLIW